MLTQRRLLRACCWLLGLELTPKDHHQRAIYRFRDLCRRVSNQRVVDPPALLRCQTFSLSHSLALRIRYNG